MLSVRYVGALTEGVTVDALGVTVLPGETVEVADDVVALNMLEQVGVWEAVNPSQATRKRNELAAAAAAEAAAAEPAPETTDGVDETPKDGE